MADTKNGNGANTTAAKAKPAALNKMDAVRQAIAKLGRDAGRGPILEFVKTQFGMEMTPDHVSTCRAEVLRQQAAKAKSGGAKAPAAKPLAATSSVAKAPVAKPTPAKTTSAAAQAKPAPAVANAPLGKGAGNGSAKMETGISLKDILTVKELVGRVTPSQLKTLIDAFAH
jgi:hypothetical protein